MILQKIVVSVSLVSLYIIDLFSTCLSGGVQTRLRTTTPPITPVKILIYRY